MDRDDDDRIWLDELAGRGGPGGDSPAAREARALRSGILALREPAGSLQPSPDAAREAALIARARREGLLPAEAEIRQAPVPLPLPAGSDPTVRAARRRGAGWRTGLLVAAVAGFALIVGTMALRRPTVPLDETVTVRGSTDGIVRLEAKDPLALQREILGELESAGVHATGYERLGLRGIDADLPQPLTPRLRELLDRHRIPAPPDGVLRVEIAGRSGG